MKRVVGFLLVMLLISCSSTKVNQDVTLVQRPVYKENQTINKPKVINTPKVEEKVVEEMVHEPEMPIVEKSDPMPVKETMTKAVSSRVGEFSNHKRVGRIMTFLTSDELKGRDSGSEGIEKAASYIETIFKENDIKPYFDTYRDELSNFDNAFNVVGYLEGTDSNLKNEFIIIGAHYDHIGIIAEENGDTIANGANDNASGTTIVLELARYFGHQRNNKRSIIFALFSAEEKGLLGSKHLAKKLKAENLNLYAMLNYEMVGVPLVNKDYLMYVTGFEESNLAGICNLYVSSNMVGYLPKAKELSLFQRSDNYPFYTEFNVPCQTFSTFDFTNFDHYHRVGDEATLIDFEHMANIVNRSIPMVEGITNSLTKMIKLN